MKTVAIILTVLAVGAVIDAMQGTALVPALNGLTVVAAIVAWVAYYRQRETPPPGR